MRGRSGFSLFLDVPDSDVWAGSSEWVYLWVTAQFVMDARLSDAFAREKTGQYQNLTWRLRQNGTTENFLSPAGWAFTFTYCRNAIHVVFVPSMPMTALEDSVVSNKRTFTPDYWLHQRSKIFLRQRSLATTTMVGTSNISLWQVQERQHHCVDYLIKIQWSCQCWSKQECRLVSSNV